MGNWCNHLALFILIIIDWSIVAGRRVCNGWCALRKEITSQLAQLCVYHLPSIHHFSSCILLSLFLPLIKTAEHLIYLRYGKFDPAGVIQNILFLCRSQSSQVAFLSLPNLLASPPFTPKDKNQNPSVCSDSLCENAEQEDTWLNVEKQLLEMAETLFSLLIDWSG